MTEGGNGATPLTPEEEEAVTRLLADAGGPEPMPADVVARLEDVLGELEKERAAPSGGAADQSAATGVAELRARRRWPRVLLAAAAVVVGGYTVGTVATQGTLSGSDSAVSGASESAGDSGGDSGGESAGDPTSGSMLADEDGDGRLKEQSREDDGSAGGAAELPADESGPDSGRGYDTQGVTVRLRSDRLDRGVRRALRVLEETPRAELTRAAPDETGCPAPEPGNREQSLPVRYDGEVAVLVAGPERSGTVEVTVYDCDGAELDSTLVRP